MGVGSQVTALIPCRNEQERLRECVTSARLLADEILVIDDNSSDETVALAEKLGCRVIQAPEVISLDTGQGRIEWLIRFGLGHVSTEFALRLDADERVTEQLASFCQAQIESAPIDGIRAQRRNYFVNGWLNHGGWSNVQQIFLVRVSAVRSDWSLRIHQQIPVEGFVVAANPVTAGYLLHLNYVSVQDFVERSLIGYAQQDFSSISVPRNLFSSVWTVIRIWTSFSIKIFGRVLIRQGWRDRVPGVAAGTLLAVYEVMRHLYSLESQDESQLKVDESD